MVLSFLITGNENFRITQSLMKNDISPPEKTHVWLVFWDLKLASASVKISGALALHSKPKTQVPRLFSTLMRPHTI